jgi:L-rhamnose mutarotase
MADDRLLRKAFLLRLTPGSLDAYVEHHRTLPQKWPELAAEIARNGIATITIFEIDPENLVLFSEIRDEDAWDRFWSTPAHEAWGEVMKPLMHYGDDGRVASWPITEVWRHDSMTP